MARTVLAGTLLADALRSGTRLRGTPRYGAGLAGTVLAGAGLAGGLRVLGFGRTRRCSLPGTGREERAGRDRPWLTPAGG